MHSYLNDGYYLGSKTRLAMVGEPSSVQRVIAGTTSYASAALLIKSAPISDSNFFQTGFIASTHLARCSAFS